MRKKTKLSSSSSNEEDLVEEREELMVSHSENRVSLHPTKSKKKQRKRTKLSRSSSSEMEDLVEEREELMVSPSGNSRPSSSEKAHLLRPCFTNSTEAPMLPRQSLKALSLSVSFNGWRFPNVKFKSWATKMLSLHEPTWEKAGILEAVMASAMKITKESDLVMGIAERWCPDTNTFVFPWGEATVTLEDVMVLLGFSVLGSPVFAPLDGSGEKTLRELEKEWLKIKKDNNVKFVTQVTWMGRFMGTGDELEHAAFLALWLSYFVLPTRYCHVDKAVLSIAVHLSRGNRIALAPAVLAHLYADLTLLKDHTRSDKIELNALFKLVKVWTWERFRELQPKPNILLEGQPRLARWGDVEQGDTDVRQVLDNSKSFEWRPYTKAVKNWKLPQFYPEKEMLVPVGPDLDEELISFARCIKVSELVGIHSVEHYYPNRVASQFGLIQDVPCPVVNRNNRSKEAAWEEYNKPIEGLTLFIPSCSAIPPFKTTFCDWWKKLYPQLQHSLNEKCVVESSETLKSRNIIGGDYDGTSASGSRKRTCRKRVCTMACCQTHDSDDDDLSLTIASIKKCSGGEDAPEPLGKKSRFEVDNNDSCPHQELGSVRADATETVPPPEMEQMNEDTDETGSKKGKNTVDKNNSSDPPLGFDDATDILVSPPLGTRQTFDDELDVHGGNVEKITMPNDGNNGPECLLHEDGSIASSEKKEEDSLIQKNIASNADNNEPTPCQNLEKSGESNTGNAVGDETQGHDCLFEDTVLGSEETMKSSENNVKGIASSIEECIAPGNDDRLIQEKRSPNEPVTGQKRASGGPNGDKTSDESNIHNAVGEGDVSNDSNEKSKQSWKVLASSVEERIVKAERNVAWLKARKAIKQRKFAAARLI